MKKLFLSLVLLVSFVVSSQTFTAKVTRIKDGDTFAILDSIGVETAIRVYGIDCPEKKQDYGIVAKEFTTDQVLNKTVTLIVVNKDQYGRTVAWVIYDKKKNLSQELLKEGLAWHYREYSKSRYLQRLENRARKDGIGLWSLPDPIRPSDFRLKK